MACYDGSNDLRFAHWFVKKGLIECGLKGFGEDIIFHKFYQNNSGDVLPAGPSVPEMILTQAEAMARRGNYQQAMSVLNTLRSKRIRKEVDFELTADSQQEAILLILEERRREMPFTMRWQDIRRLAYNETDYDAVALSRTFYEVIRNVINPEQIKEHTLAVKSKRYAQPILEIEIARSNYKLVQND